MGFFDWRRPEIIDPFNHDQVQRAVCFYSTPETSQQGVRQGQLWPIDYSPAGMYEFFQKGEEHLKSLVTCEPYSPEHGIMLVGMKFVGQPPNTRASFGYAELNTVVQPHVAIIYQGVRNSESIALHPRSDGLQDLVVYQVQLRVMGWGKDGGTADCMMPVSQIRITPEQQFFLNASVPPRS